MENLFKVDGGQMWAVLGKLACKLPADLVKPLRDDPGILDAMVKAAAEYRTPKQAAEAGQNPFKMTVEEQVAALRRASEEEGWDIDEEVFERLIATAPPWPLGKHAYRSFRIRFGTGDGGIATTFEAHCHRIRKVFGERNVEVGYALYLGSGLSYADESVDRIRLLKGNRTHRPVIEWILIDVGSHRDRESVTAVRGPKSLADELLVVAWLFPGLIRSLGGELSELIAAGYEFNELEPSDFTPGYYKAATEKWERAVYMCYWHGKVDIGVISLEDQDERDAVPELLT